MIPGGWDPVHRPREVFTALMAAVCDPGATSGLPAGWSALEGAAAVALTLADATVTLGFGEGEDDWSTALARATGACVVPMSQADVVVVRTGLAAVLPQVRRGRPTHPEEGATVVIAVPSPPWTPATLTGPGLPRPARRRLPLSEDDLEARNLAVAEPPLGVDVYAVTAGAVHSLPRSTTVTFACAAPLESRDHPDEATALEPSCTRR